MLVVIIIGIVVLGIYYSNLGGSVPGTIDPVKPDDVFIEKIITGQSEPARRKPTPTPDPVVQSTPESVDSNFLHFDELNQSDTF